MPELLLQVISVDAAPSAAAIAHVFSDAGGTIGRDASCSFVLADKHRRISRLHATVSFPAGVPTLTNSSTLLPVLVDEKQLNCGELISIADGSMIEIGPYVMKARTGAAIATSTSLPASVGADEMSASQPGAVPHQPLSSGSHEVLVFLENPRQVNVSWAAPAATLEAGTDHDAPLPYASMMAEQLPPTIQIPPPALIDSDPFAELLSGIGMPPGAEKPLPSNDKSASQPTSIFQPVFSGNNDPLDALGYSSAPFATAPMRRDDPTAARNGDDGPIPNHFNPFALTSAVSRNTADPLADLLGPDDLRSKPFSAAQGNEPSIDSLFQGGGGQLDVTSALRGSSIDPLDNLFAPEGLDSDPLSLFAPSQLPRQAAQPIRDDLPEIGSSFTPPMARVSPVPTGIKPSSQVDFAEPMAPAQPKPTTGSGEALESSTSTEPLAAAFLRGAGLRPSALPQGLTPELMATIGSLLLSATAGAIDMLAARTATKREVQASVTIISVQANNPLKFLPNAEVALQHLLGKNLPGFMRADVAMRDAFDDLRAHEVGVIAGTRAALAEVLGKFDPAMLADKLVSSTLLNSLLPSTRKAKLWDMYLERYQQLRREAEDDFQSAFGHAFLLAYERETARIKDETPTT